MQKRIRMEASISSLQLKLILSLILVSVSWSAETDYVNKTGFLGCLRHELQNSTSISEVIYTPQSTSYFNILNFSVQNLRFNTPETPRPLVIVTPEDESHVQSAVNCCKRYGIEMRIRSGGHDFEGLSFISQVPFALIDLLNLRSVTVNAEERTAWVQAGARLGELYYSIANKSRTLAFPAGACPTVGVGGHIGGGGYGMLVRKFGLAVDHVIDARLVDVNGRILDRKSMGEDLFWAIRGGGGSSFGVILAWKVMLVVVPETVTVFTVQRTLEQNATSLVHEWQSIADKTDENINIRIFLRSVNSGQDGGRTIQAYFISLFLGRVDSLLQLMQKDFPELGLLKNDCQEMSWIESVLYFYPVGNSLDVLLDRTYSFRMNDKGKSDFVKEAIPEHVFEGIWKRFHQVEPGAALMVLTPLGGRMNELPAWEIPFPHRAGNKYIIEYQVGWQGGGQKSATRHFSWIRRLFRYMAPYVSNNPRSAYLNYRDLDIGVNNAEGHTSYSKARIWGQKYFLRNFKRLVYVKTIVDPTNFFKNEQSIPSVAYMY